MAPKHVFSQHKFYNCKTQNRKQGETLWETWTCSKKQGKHYVKYGEMKEEMGGNMWEIAAYWDFLDT